MAKPFKILAIALGVAVLLLVGIAVAFALFFDPNAFRGRISAQVKEQTGRELVINGDIGLKFFPWLGVKIGQVKLGNAPGFGDTPFAEIGQAEVSVQLLPLLHKEIRASTITLEGLKLNLAKDASGKTNWDDLVQKQKEQKPAPAPGAPSGPPPAFEIGGLEIKDASLTYSDAQAKKHYAVQDLNFKTGALKPGKAVDLNASLKLSSNEPKIDADLKLGASLEADTAARRYALHKLKLDVDASGAGVPGGRQNLKLTGDLDYDQAQGTAKLGDAKLEVAGLTVTAQLDGKNLNGDTPSFSGPLAIQPFDPRSVLSNLKIALEPADANALKQASLNANLAATQKSATLSDLKLKLDDTSLTGKLEVRDFGTQSIAFALNVDRIDLDRYKSAGTSGSAAKAPAGKSESFNNTELPVKALDSISAAGSLDIGSLKLGGLKVSDVALKLDLPKGKPKTDELAAKLYGGSIVSHSEITPGEPPRIASKAAIKSVQVGPLLKDMQGKDRVTGTGDLDFDIRSSGRTVGDVRKNLDGELGFNLANGAVKGFNLGQILRQAQAVRGVLRGENVPKESAGSQQTDFAELKGHAKIVNGVLTTDYLTAASPAFRFSGEGSVDLANEQINYLAKPTVVETSEGSGGKGLDELKGLTVPIRITGSFDNPKYTVDVGEALKQKAAERVNKEVQKQEERLKGKFGDFLRRQLGPQQQPQQPSQPPPPKNP